jgi:hypothetical protein
MEVQVSVLCDSAADYDGKLCVLGCFDTIFAQGFPATHPQCAVALRILFRREDEGAHSVRVNFIDEDGRSVIPPLETEIEVATPDEWLLSTHNLVLNLQQLRFALAGQYSVDVSMDGQIVARIPLRVRAAGPAQ